MNDTSPNASPGAERSGRASKWLRSLGASGHALALLGAASFFETIIVPIPIELVLIPFMLLNRHRIWTIATVTTLGCLAGALVGYGVGFFLFESAGQWLLQVFDHGDAFDTFRSQFNEYGFWAILAIGIIPIPFQVAMLTAGAAGYPLPLFVAAAVIARGIRYYGLALLVLWFGQRALQLWKSHAAAVTFGLAGAVVIVFFAVRYLSG